MIPPTLVSQSAAVRTDPEDYLESLLSETAGSAGSLILFGAGPLGRYTLAGLRKVGVEPIAFADNNSQLWNQRIDGLNVLSPTEAVALYGSRAAFVVTIYNGSSPRNQLRDLGCQAVIPFAPLFWRYATVFIPGPGWVCRKVFWNAARRLRRATAS